MDDLNSYDIQEKIETLQAKVKHFESLLKFHNLFEIPLKYRKAFPKENEYPYFTETKFKIQSCSSLMPGRDLVPAYIDRLPSQEDLDKSKERMGRFAKMANKKYRKPRRRKT